MSWTHSISDIILYFDNYLKVMERYSNEFKEKIFSVELDELTINSKQVSKKMFEFCELEWNEESLEYHKRKDLFTSTASNIQIRQKIYKYNDTKYNVYKNI